MRVPSILAILAVIVAAVGVVATTGTQAANPRAYVISSARPLTGAQTAQLKAAGVSLKYVYKNFGGAAGTISDASLAKVRALPFVKSVNPDARRDLADVSVAPAPASALPGTPYWLDLIDAENNNAYDGSGVWVAVLDSGFYPNWRDYFDESKILASRGRAFIAVLGNPNDNQWDVGSDPHGMAVAATVVGYRFVDDRNEGGWGGNIFATGAAGTYDVPGVAPGAKIVPVKVCEPLGCYTSAINAGIDYVTSLKLANPAQPIVINESLGGGDLEESEQAAIDAAIDAGVVIVASAGNEGEEGMGYPGAYAPVISVAAGGWRDQWNPDKTWWLRDVPDSGDAAEVANEVYVAGFSSRELPGQELDVTSTGRYLLLPYPCAKLYKDGQISSATVHRTCASKATPDNAHAAPFQYLFISGTSFSAPTIAGVAALMLDKDAGLTQAEVESALKSSAVPIPADSVTVTHRTGDPLTETWGNDATGSGWVFIDNALAAIP